MQLFGIGYLKIENKEIKLMILIIYEVNIKTIALKRLQRKI